MTDLAHARAAIELAECHTGPKPGNASVFGTKLLIVVDRREFFRDCLASWLNSLGEEFEGAGVADVRQSLMPDHLGSASGVILSHGREVSGERWLEQQVDWLREQRPDLPIIALLDPDEATGNQAVTRLSLQGHIPTSSTMAIAKAALRLIVVGGSYFPRTPHGSLSVIGAAPAQIAEVLPLTSMLTPRELVVMELLAQGTANKIIAYRLGMSQSTVKVHVHNILKKLKVRNRTEAAVTARNMRIVPDIAANRPRPAS